MINNKNAANMQTEDKDRKDIEEMSAKELKAAIAKWEGKKAKQTIVSGANINKDYWVDSDGDNHNYISEMFSPDCWIKAYKKELKNRESINGDINK